MHPLVEKHRAEIEALCRRYHVRRLDVFGSAARDNGEPRDIDLLVEFDSVSDMGPADQYFGLLEALERLFDRPVQLVTQCSLRNPHLIRSIEETRKTLHVAGDYVERILAAIS